jgi:hypothetical protein
MLLFEFTSPNPLLINLVAVIGQLKSEIDSGQENPEWTVDELLQHLKNSNVIVDKEDLYDMIKNPPLNHSIENIQGDRVIFRGQGSIDGDAGAHDAEQSKKIVAQMAHNAAK